VEQHVGLFSTASEERFSDFTIQKDPKGGSVTRTVTLPVTVTLGEGVELSKLSVQVKIGYRGSEAKVTVGQIEQKSDAPKGFFARLFGG
jgi:hypothetical protein